MNRIIVPEMDLELSGLLEGPDHLEVEVLNVVVNLLFLGLAYRKIKIYDYLGDEGKEGK